LAEMFEILRQTVEDGISAVASRVYVNLPNALEAIGRSREAVPILEEGLGYARKFGLSDKEAWIWGNLAESLHSLGRWDRAAESATRAELVGRSAQPRGFHAGNRAALALARGDLPEAARQLTAARGYFGTHDRAPQHELPLTELAIGIAAAEGRLLDARAELERVLDAGFPPGTQRYAWPLLLTAATMEADALGLPVAERDRAKILHRIREAARPLATNAPVWLAHERWVRAELLRAESTDTPDHWYEALTALEPLERPYDLARVRHRLAQALLSAPGGAEQCDRERATELLRLAHAAADHLGARPLADAVMLLAQRARLTLTAAPAPGRDDPVRSLGLTGRERDVLRLVALGRTNRLIAEELFISPKTASVHVSNILAKLGVSGRGEAAAVAHRLGLFPAEALHAPITE
ncbi:MAG TPA: response regulator transcription factor, partial [Thermoanaerobaculia bacterium]